MKSLKIFTAAALISVLSFGTAFAEGGVKGTVSYTGRSSKAKKVKMNADPKCVAQYGKKGFKYRSQKVSKEGGLLNAFVYVSKGLEGKKFKVPEESKIVLNQKGCWYHPHVLGLQVGQTLEILNSDPTMHNVNASPEFNAAMPPAVKMLKKTFKKEKVMFKIKCNVHPWMTAYAGILSHPYFAVTDKDGAYEIADLPPGKYTLTSWHEKRGTKETEIEVKKKGATADFEYIKKKKKKKKKTAKKDK